MALTSTTRPSSEVKPGIAGTRKLSASELLLDDLPEALEVLGIHAAAANGSQLLMSAFKCTLSDH
jgi:hypothetical protein